MAVSLALMSMPASPAQAPVPVDKEPRHHLKFENSHVRVFDVVVPPGDTTLYHHHAQDYVFVMIGAANLKAQMQGGEPFDMILKDGQARYTAGPIIHRVSNVGKADFRNITIEVLEPSRAGKGTLDRGAEYNPVLENDRVRVYKLRLEPGQSTRASRNQPELTVAVTPGAILIETEAGASAKRGKAVFKPGDFEFRQGERTESLKNTGKGRFEAIIVEWK
jgi:quercetin dioxygenase-like cupin family protein